MRLAVVVMLVVGLLGCSDKRYAVLRNASREAITLHLSYPAEGRYPAHDVVVELSKGGSKAIGKIDGLRVSSAGCEYLYELNFWTLAPHVIDFPIRVELSADHAITVIAPRGMRSKLVGNPVYGSPFRPTSSSCGASSD